MFFVILSTSGYFIYNNVKDQIGTQIESELTKSIDIITKTIETLSKNNSRSTLKLMVSKNKQIVDYYYTLYKNSEISKSEALEDLNIIFSKQKIGKTGYLAAIHNDKKNNKYISALHPFLPKGADVTELAVVKKLMRIKEGYFEYLWKNNNEEKYRKKAMYVTYFEPWDYAITATSYLDELVDVINIDDIKEDIKFYKIGMTGYIYIINSQSDIIYYPNLKNKNNAEHKNEEIDKIFKTIVKNKNGRIYYDWIEDVDNKTELRKKVALFRYLPKLDWYIAASAYTEEFSAPLVKLQSTFLVSFILLTVFMVITTLWMSSYITKPLYDIIDKLKYAKQNKFKEKISIKSNDEFGELSKHYNAFIDKLDVSSTKLANTAHKFHAILDNTTTIIYIKNLEGEYETVNKEYRKIYKLKKEAIIGKTDIEIFGKKTGLKLRKHDLEVIKKKKSVSFEESIYHEGKKYYYISIKFPFYDENNNITSVCGISTNITNIKNAEDKIININKNLEYEVTKRTSDLLLSNIELEKSISELKETQVQLIQSEKMASLGDLVAGISHEINTPVGLGVTGITHLEYITQEIVELYENDNISQNEFEEYLKSCSELTSSIHTNLNRAADLIKSFKQVAVDQSSEEKRVFSIKKYLDEILISLQYETKNIDCQILIECDKNIKLNSYPGAFSQIITNFVMNSVVHGFKNLEKGVINILIKKQSNYIVLTYKDNGNGIKEEYLSKIYDPFFTTNRNHGGSGLGLNIIYNIITTTLNGQITCSSKQNEGVEFIVRIPIDD